MWLFLHLMPSISFLSQICESQCPIWTGFSNKTLSLPITLGPSLPPWQVLTVVLPWQLPIWGLGRRGAAREGEEIGREIRSSVVASENAEGFTTPAKHYICEHHLPLVTLSSSFPTNCLVKPGKWWMLQRNEGGGGWKKCHAEPLGTGSTSGSLSETTLWWPLKCLSGSNLNPGRQTQYPDQKKPVLLHSSAAERSLFTSGVNEEGRIEAGEKEGR